MSAAKHTPGPWFHVGGSDRRLAPFIRADGDAIGIPAIASICARGNASEQAANARLIAAAPELLEALERARMVIEGAGFPVDASITRAIAKATGGAS